MEKPLLPYYEFERRLRKESVGLCLRVLGEEALKSDKCYVELENVNRCLLNLHKDKFSGDKFHECRFTVSSASRILVRKFKFEPKMIKKEIQGMAERCESWDYEG
ncbi:unnamed protein product [Moneuplotes crassus]|uniref:Uncharacterized protein n=1 Tax=Euplotes crassus TaxID=5936 RepID=A0AAD1Y7Z2_EUPCR|nr:unnamed protein product [Moneuplotes crassus]